MLNAHLPRPQRGLTVRWADDNTPLLDPTSDVNSAGSWRTTRGALGGSGDVFKTHPSPLGVPVLKARERSRPTATFSLAHKNHSHEAAWEKEQGQHSALAPLQDGRDTQPLEFRRAIKAPGRITQIGSDSGLHEPGV